MVETCGNCSFDLHCCCSSHGSAWSWKRGTPCCIVWAHSWTMGCPAASWSPVCTSKLMCGWCAICAMTLLFSNQLWRITAITLGFSAGDLCCFATYMPPKCHLCVSEARQGCSLCPVGHLSMNLEAPTPQQKRHKTS